jgi:hypothetical protein
MIQFSVQWLLFETALYFYKRNPAHCRFEMRPAFLAARESRSVFEENRRCFRRAGRNLIDRPAEPASPRRLAEGRCACFASSRRWPYWYRFLSKKTIILDGKTNGVITEPAEVQRGDLHLLS